jgi:hypothetical protein
MKSVGFLSGFFVTSGKVTAVLFVFLSGNAIWIVLNF